MKEFNKADFLADAELQQLITDAKELLAEQQVQPQRPEPRAEDVHIDYEKFYGEVPGETAEEAAPPRPLTAYEQSKPDYQTARREAYKKEREQKRLEREQARLAREQEDEERLLQMQEEKKPKLLKKLSLAAKKTDESYGDWLYEQGDDEETVQQRQFIENHEEIQKNEPKTRKKLPFWLVIPALLACLILMFVVICRPPAADTTLVRKDGCTTILLAGTDAGGYRTDTMMLLSVDREKKSMSLVSIPRDTLVYCSYAVPKINSAYGWADGGESGMQELMRCVAEIIGFEPDGYLLIDLTAFEKLVDLMGGVSYLVPADMHYEDPTQGLSIHLAAGHQKLDGQKALQLVRFRSGYANADLGRVSVQREFITAALDQWTNVLHAFKLPSAVRLLTESTVTDLTAGNLLWLAQSAVVCTQGVQTVTLPGAPRDIAGGSYYVLDPQATAQMVNTCCNPYEQGVSAADLAIRVG